MKTLENLLTDKCIEDNHASEMRKTKDIFKCMCFETLLDKVNGSI